MSKPANNLPISKTAHDSGDGSTIYHCPFCGSGQVIARSDRTIECEFCHTAFTVQVQPMFPAFPQTINGMPVQVPGMPGEVGTGGPDTADDFGAGIGEAGFGEDAPVDPQDIGEEGDVQDADDEAAEGDDADDGDDNAPPWAKKSSRQFVTEKGYILSEAEYRNHLLIKNASNPKAMAAMIKEARR